MKKFILILSFLLITSCASVPFLDVLNPTKPSIDATVQLGKSNQQEKNNIKLENGDTTKQEAQVISNDRNYAADKIENITQGMSKWELALYTLLAGIAIPKGNVLWQGFKTVVVDISQGVFYPFKSLGNFILKLIGK